MNLNCVRAVVPEVYSQRIRDRFPGYPWIHCGNGYFEYYLLFKLKEWRFVKYNQGTSLFGDMFVSCGRYNI
jgi:hypothetical protein